MVKLENTPTAFNISILIQDGVAQIQSVTSPVPTHPVTPVVHRCSGKTRSGEECKRKVKHKYSYCASHRESENNGAPEQPPQQCSYKSPRTSGSTIKGERCPTDTKDLSSHFCDKHTKLLEKRNARSKAQTPCARDIRMVHFQHLPPTRRAQTPRARTTQKERSPSPQSPIQSPLVQAVAEEQPSSPIQVVYPDDENPDKKCIYRWVKTCKFARRGELCNAPTLTALHFMCSKHSGSPRSSAKSKLLQTRINLL